MNKLSLLIVRIIVGSIIAIAVLFPTFYIVAKGDYTVPATVADDPSIPHIEINGAVFHSEQFGDPKNPALIVIHGGPGWDYRGLLSLKALSDEYFVVFYDQRGTGLSPRVEAGGLTLESTLQDLDSVVDRFSNGRKVFLVGHSWGGMLASGYIGRHPEKVEAAVLAEPGFLTTELARDAHSRFGPRWEASFLWRASKAWFQSFHVRGVGVDAASDWLMGRIVPYVNTEYYCGSVVPEAGALHWRPGSSAMNEILFAALKNGEIEIDLVEGAERFKGPVLFLASGCNTLIGVGHQRKQSRFFQNATLKVIEGSGHSMFGEKPEESVGAVREFLKAKQTAP